MSLSKNPSIMFVCTANIVRSPMAAGLLKQILKNYPGFEDYQIGSSGVQGLEGFPAEKYAQLIMETRGIDLRRHSAMRTNRDMVLSNDLILTMEKKHKTLLLEAFPEVNYKLFTFGEFTGLNKDIEDPVMKSIEEYASSARLINQLLEEYLIKFIYVAKRNALGLEPSKVESETVPDDVVQIILDEIDELPLVFQYNFLRMLLKHDPFDLRIRNILKTLTEKVPPSKDELKWLHEIQLHAILLPLTCQRLLNEVGYLHPEINSNVESIRTQLKDPDHQELFSSLEKLFHRKLAVDKFRLNIWDLSAQFGNLPLPIGDYDQAYQELRKLYPYIVEKARF